MLRRILLIAVPAVWLVSFLLTLARVEPFYTNFYSIAWWCYILLLASCNERRAGASRFAFPSLFRQPVQYLALILFSAAVWFFFELYNIRLHNWAYWGVPSERWIRWPGYFVAYGTVLPGIFETARWLEGRLPSHTPEAGMRPARERAAEPFRKPGWERASARVAVAAGLLCMILPLAYPDLFFPVIWIGLVLLLDPMMPSLGEPSLLASLFCGNPRRPLLLLCSGIVCGFFWEFWNYWAGAKWVYLLPYFQSGKVFEMPVLGYLGFMPFAWECWLLYVFARHRWRQAGAAGRSAMALLLSGICAAGVYAVDHFVIQGYRP